MPPAGPPPAATQGLDRDQLLRLDEPERVARLQDALCQLYLAFTGHADDGDADGDLDPTEPLILESLVAAQLNAELEGLLGVSVPISTLMLDGLSIAKVSEELSRALQDGSSQETPPAPPGAPKLVPDPASRHLEFPLAEIQQAYWVGRDPVFELGNVSAYLYAEYRAIDFEAPRAERALRRVIARHDMLRSVVGEDGAQRVLPEAPPYHVDVIDLRSEEAGAAQAVLAEAREQMTQRQTRPDQWQPFEVRVFLLDERRAQVHMSIDMVKLDAWSAQLLLAEWFHLYDDPDKDLPEISLTFRDYVAWTRELEASESFERSRRYWLDRVPSLPAAPELPLVKPLAAVTRPRFTTRRARLDRDTWSRLKDRAARDGLTPSMLLCAAYTEVLAAWSSRQRFTLSVSGGRPPVHPQIGQVLGSFAKLMLLEVDATATGGFLTRARALQAQLSRDFEHRHFGGLEVLRELARIHGPTRAGMPVLFTSVLPQGGVGGLSRPRWLVGDPYLEWAMPQLMLENQVLELGGDLIVTWGAVEKLFPEGLLDEMFGAYRRFLERLAYQDDAWTGDRLELLPPAQLARWEAVNRTEGPLPEGLLHTPFAERVVEHGDAPAVISTRRTLSYAQLDRHATHLARTLRQRGVAPNSLVAVSMEKGWEQIVAVLGVLRSGAAYLPLDPDLPTRRLHYLLANGEVSHVLTQPWVDERLAWPDGVARVQVHEEDGWRAADPRPMEDAQAPTDLAYVIYTSGSTGQPKGVAIDHRSALNTILDVNRRFDIGPADRVLAVSALSFDLSVYDLFGPLAVGGAIVIPDPGGLKDPAHWTELLQRERVTVWNSAPALMEMLAEHPEARGDSLRLALLSGDWIPTSLPERIWRTFPDTAVISLGGATEASIWSIFHPIGEQDCRRRSIPYGRPLTNQRFHVLNQRLEPCPELVPGEIYIAGAGLAKCYWRDEERTKASFLTHPHTGEPLYRTGDLGRYLPGGEIEFLGRDDSQVKVNGYRIELGEVEAALAEHPAVRSAVAVAHGQREESKSLAAYVLVDDAARTGSAEAVAAELRGFLAERLPGHAVPAQIVEVEELPLTANGKLDRSALSRPVESTASRRQHRVPRTPAEAQLVELWGNLLEAPKVGVDDNFFELGGTSLLAVRLAIRAQEAGLALSTADVLRHPTVAELAALASGRTELPPQEVLGSCAAVPAETRPEANGERR